MLPPRNRQPGHGRLYVATVLTEDRGVIMKKLALVSVTALLLTSSMASAAEMAVKYVPLATPCCEGWGGFYFGVYFGSGAGHTSSTVTDSSTNTQSSTSTAFFDPTTFQSSTQTFTSRSSGTASLTG